MKWVSDTYMRALSLGIAVCMSLSSPVSVLALAPKTSLPTVPAVIDGDERSLERKSAQKPHHELMAVYYFIRLLRHAGLERLAADELKALLRDQQVQFGFEPIAEVANNPTETGDPYAHVCNVHLGSTTLGVNIRGAAMPLIRIDGHTVLDHGDRVVPRSPVVKMVVAAFNLFGRHNAEEPLAQLVRGYQGWRREKSVSEDQGVELAKKFGFAGIISDKYPALVARTGPGIWVELQRRRGEDFRSDIYGLAERIGSFQDLILNETDARLIADALIDAPLVSGVESLLREFYPVWAESNGGRSMA